MRYPVNHPIIGQTNASITMLTGGPDEEVEQTLALMRRYAVEDSRSSLVQDIARQCGLGSGIPPGQYCQNVYQWVRSNLRFLNDEPLGAPLSPQMGLGDGDIVEVLIRPVDMLALSPESRIGDCDDYSMLVSSLLCAAEIPHGFNVVAADGRDPSRFSHVYVVALTESPHYGSERIPLDASHGPHYRWEVPTTKVFRSRYYPVVSKSDVLECFALAAVVSLGAWGIWKIWRTVGGI